MKKKFWLAVVLFGISSSCLAMNTVEHVDLKRYLGKWYEIARIDSWFEKNCIKSNAEYTHAANNQINVLNSCYDINSNTTKQAKGRAWVIDSKTNAKLKVSFLPSFLKFLDNMFSGDYWILKIDPEYSTVLVGEPSRKYLWILSRKTHLDEHTYQEYLKYAHSLGYNTETVLRTPQ